MSITDIVQKSDTRAGRAFDVCIMALIVYSVVTLSFETLPSLPESVAAFLRTSEIVVTLIFTAEYLLRITTAPDRKKYIFSFYGLVDLAAILPFYISTGLDLRAVRAFRLLRVFRLLKLQRYSKALDRFGKALVIAKEEVIIFLFATFLLLYLSAVGIYYFENAAQPEAFKSIFHSLWWAVTTLTTVGYGDVYPITAGGRIFTFFILMLGLGIVAVPAGLVASSLSEVRENEEKGI
jgi:voltage-gated potassium channel